MIMRGWIIVKLTIVDSSIRMLVTVELTMRNINPKINLAAPNAGLVDLCIGQLYGRPAAGAVLVCGDAMRLILNIDDRLARRLRRLAREQQLPVSCVVTALIADGVYREVENGDGKETLLREADSNPDGT